MRNNPHCFVCCVSVTLIVKCPYSKFLTLDICQYSLGKDLVFIEQVEATHSFQGIKICTHQAYGEIRELNFTVFIAIPKST